MSTLPRPKHVITEEEYLAIERNAETRSEYYAGEMFAMAGAGESHNLIVAHLLASPVTQLRGRPAGPMPATCASASRAGTTRIPT
jgi:hypothetical protein